MQVVGRLLVIRVTRAVIFLSFCPYFLLNTPGGVVEFNLFLDFSISVIIGYGIMGHGSSAVSNKVRLID